MCDVCGVFVCMYICIAPSRPDHLTPSLYTTQPTPQTNLQDTPLSPTSPSTTPTNQEYALLPHYLDAITKAKAHVLRTGILDLPSTADMDPSQIRVIGRTGTGGAVGGGGGVAVYLPAPFGKDRAAVMVVHPLPPAGSSGGGEYN